jgi:tetratricopeptide (TPR) repeat protein/8-oxo-dGTP pyrophosphatase MutT (NUDIX family)
MGLLQTIRDVLRALLRRRTPAGRRAGASQPATADGKLRIFLSYGHDEHARLAEQMDCDLRARGHEVWFDRSGLRGGVDWAQRIEQGLDWASADPARGRFLLLMTPHSVRRPDGFCLNELTYALDQRLTVVPVMVVEVKPPLEIYRIQWLDMRSCVPFDQQRQRYADKITELLDAVEQGFVRSAKEDPRDELFRWLDPLTFETEIASHLKRFTGREWVFRKIDEWLGTPNAPPVFWLTGKPGVGKTAIAAWLCRHRDEVGAFFLCRHRHTYKSDPRRCIFSVACQLSTQLPKYLDRLKDLNLEQVVRESDAGTLFDMLIAEPLARLAAPPRPVAILIDALDEVTEGDRNDLAAFLGTEVSRGPRWLRWIVTSRPELPVRVRLQSVDPYDVDQVVDMNQADLREFLARELRPFAAANFVPPEVIDAIVARSGGLFLYAEWVRRELEQGRLCLDRLDEFPKGLGGIYLQFFERQFRDLADYREVIRPALELIAAAQEPLRLSEIAAVFGWNGHVAEEFCDRLGSLFIGRDGRLEPFHKSVMDWLTEKSRAGVYWLDRAEGHRLLADQGWSQYQHGAATMSNYALAYLPAHLAQAARWGDLETYLSDPVVIETRCARGAFAQLAADLAILDGEIGLPGELKTPEKEAILGRVSAAMLDVFCRHGDQAFWQEVRGGLHEVFRSYEGWPAPWRRCLEGHNHFRVMLFLGNTLDMDLRFDDAEGVFARMLAAAGPGRPEEYATAHIRMAYVLEHQSQIKEAEGHLLEGQCKLKDALDLVEGLLQEPGAKERLGRDYYWALHHQGICLWRMGRYDEASQALEEILAAGIRGAGLTTGPLHQLGIIDLHLGRYRKAEEKFETCRQRRGEDRWNHRRAYEHRRLGQAYALTGRFPQARAALDKATEISTNCVDRRYLRELNEDAVAFLDAPRWLLDEYPETVDVKDLMLRFGIDRMALPWVFRVLHGQYRGYVEVLDEGSGRPTGQATRYDLAHVRGTWHASVAVLIGDGQGNVLLQKRGEKDSYGKWDVSVAGHAGVGESDVLAAIRETAEEIGVVLAPIELRRLRRRRQLIKQGSPEIEHDHFAGPFHYLYHKDQRNNERVSAFHVRATERHRAQLAGKPPGTMEVAWKPWEEVVAEARTHPDRFASALRQLLHPEILARIAPWI